MQGPIEEVLEDAQKMKAAA